jgi:hypothetical protein
LRESPVIVSGSYFGEGAAPVMSEQIPTLRPRIFSNGSTASTDTYPPAPLSPGKSDGASEAALNARTERKIMDLEISNSSLLAINRTLEREMRQQKAELRRFRRLSRSGRISMAPSTRSFSGAALSVTGELDEGESEISNRSQDDVSDISDEDSIADESILSPGSLAEHDAKHRVNDEKRVMLDLARHQEVLVDSQRMNQSLKRCLGWTEELIKEGQRALEYNVHVQDVELGGRVLAPEELGEIGESGRGLLSPSTEYNALFSPVEASELSFAESPSIGTLSPRPSISADPSTWCYFFASSPGGTIDFLFFFSLFLADTFAQYPFSMPFILIHPFISSIDTGYLFTLWGLTICTMRFSASCLSSIAFTISIRQDGQWDLSIPDHFIHIERFFLAILKDTRCATIVLCLFVSTLIDMNAWEC